MKMPVVKGLVPALVALIVFSFISTAIASDVLTALAIGKKTSSLFTLSNMKCSFALTLIAVSSD